MALSPEWNEDLAALFQWSYDGVAVWVPTPWRIAYGNPAFWRLVSVGPVSADSDASLDCIEPQLQTELIGVLERLVRSDTGQSMISAQLTTVASAPTEIRVCRLTQIDKSRIGMIVREIGERAPVGSDDAQRRDPLTGLFDREFLARRLSSLLLGVRSADRRFAVLFLDLDNFKQVNDRFGHLLGDNVLREAALRIAGSVREGDYVVRFGGDEFVVLIEGVGGADDVEPVISRIRAALAKPIALPEGDVTLTLSVGVAMASDEHRTPEDLLAAADRAMYAAKRDV